jgi:hypothetical protein
MALTAIQRRVLSFQPETGQRMIKSLLAVLPMNEIKIPPLMLDMAGLTDLVLGATVQSVSGLALCQDPPVTPQAVIRNQLLVTAVTFGAVLHSFEKGM